MFSTADSASTAASAMCARARTRGPDACAPHGAAGSPVPGALCQRREGRSRSCWGDAHRAESAASSRSRSASSFQAPTDARSQGRRECCAGSPRTRRSRARSPSGSALVNETSVLSPARHHARGRCAQSSSASRPASVRARSCTACQPADSSTRDGAPARRRPSRRSATASRSAARPRAAPASSPASGFGEVGIAAPRDAQALAQRGADAQHPGPSGPHSHFWPAPAYASQPSARTSTGIAPTPWAPSSRTGTSRLRQLRGRVEPLTQPTCEQATSRVSGPTGRRCLRSGTCARHAAQLACGAQRAEQARVLLVAGEDLIAWRQLQPADHLGHAFGGAGRQRERRRGRTRARWRRRSRSAASSSERRSKWAPRDPPASSRSSSAAAARTAAAGSGPSVPAFRYATLGKDGKLGAQPRQAPQTARIPACARARTGSRPCGSRRSSERESAEMARFMRWAAARAGGASSRTMTSCGDWSVDELEDFWANVWEFCGVRAVTSSYEPGARRRRRDARRALVRGRRAELRGEPAAGPARTASGRDAEARWRCCTARSCASSDELTWGELGEQVAAAAAAACARWG